MNPERQYPPASHTCKISPPLLFSFPFFLPSNPPSCWLVFDKQQHTRCKIHTGNQTHKSKIIQEALSIHCCDLPPSSLVLFLIWIPEDFFCLPETHWTFLIAHALILSLKKKKKKPLILKENCNLYCHLLGCQQGWKNMFWSNIWVFRCVVFTRELKT